ncbi:MAG: ABC transporter permease [Candidatus Marinimicrobia bacterium]|nr:ABC transporter permease [Candidatus Neomarinimicrobiota bacterium]
MNRLKFIFKFIVSKQATGKYNWNLLFPFGGVIIGCLTVALTLAVMEGMEYAIFTKLENISFPGKLMNINSINSEELEDYLLANGTQSQRGIEDQIIIMNGGEFRLVTIHGIENFGAFRENVFSPDLNEIDKSIDDSKVYIGRSLAVRLDLTLGDEVLIAHPERINIFTGLPNRKQMVVGGIFDVEILDYNQKHIFCQYNLISDFLPEKQNTLNLDKPLDGQLLSNVKEIFPEIRYNFWEENHGSFISAMKLEKYTYSIIGFLIVGIAGFTLMSIMSLSVMQKIPQIGILRAIGMRAVDIKNIFIFQAISTSIISSIIGILLSLAFIQLDNQFNLIHLLFPGGLFFDFPLILKNIYIILIFSVSLILLVLAGLYPSLKAAHIDPIKAIGFRR